MIADKEFAQALIKHVINPLANFATEIGVAGKPRMTSGNVLSQALIEAEILEFVLPDFKLDSAIQNKEQYTQIL